MEPIVVPASANPQLAQSLSPSNRHRGTSQESKGWRMVDIVCLMFLSFAQSGYFVVQSNLLSQKLLNDDPLNQRQIEDKLLKNLLAYFGIDNEREVHFEFATPPWTEELVVSDVGIFSENLQRRVAIGLLKRMHNAGYLAVETPRYLAVALLWRFARSVIQGCIFGWKKEDDITVDRISEFLEATDMEIKRRVMKLMCADLGLASDLPAMMQKAQQNAGENWTESKLLRVLHFIVADTCSSQRVWKMDPADNNFGYGFGNFASAKCIDLSEGVLKRLESIVNFASKLPVSLSDDVVKCWVQWFNCTNGSAVPNPKNERKLREVTVPSGELLSGVAVVLYTVYNSAVKKSSTSFSLEKMQNFRVVWTAFSTGIIDDAFTIDQSQIDSLKMGYEKRVKRLKALSAMIVASRMNPKGVSLMLGVAVSSKEDEVFIGVTEKYRADAVELLIWLAMGYTNVIPVFRIDCSNHTMHYWILKRVAEMVFAPQAMLDKLPVNERNEMTLMLSNLNSSIKQAWFRRFHQDSMTITPKVLNRVKLRKHSEDPLLTARQSCWETFESAQKKLNESCICDYNNPPQLSPSELSALFVWFDRAAICLEPLLTPHSKSLDLVCIQFGPPGEHATHRIGNRFQAKPCTRYCALFSSAHTVWSRLVEGVTRNSLRDNFGADEF